MSNVLMRGRSRPGRFATMVASGTLFGGLPLLALDFAGGTNLDRYEYREIVMGVEARVALYAAGAPAARSAARAAFDRMNALDAVMSDYRAQSELMEVCRRAGEITPIGDDLFGVLARARDISTATGGAFDVTVGPIVRLWRDARRSGTLPDDTALAEARALVGWEMIALDAAARTVRLARPGMQLDLGGIGKGFAADEAVRTMREHGVPSCLVDLGGDVVAGDAPPGKDGWIVGVETGASAESIETYTLANGAIATSGDAFQFVEIDGVRYSHIVDPRTGLGLTNRVAVVVRAGDGATADALASAVSVLGVAGAAEVERAFPGARVTCVPPSP